MAAQPPERSIREMLLNIVQEQRIQIQQQQGGTLQQTAVLDAVWRHHKGHDEEAILTAWQDQFRTGLLAWGYNLNNPNQPFFHLTERGRNALANVSRDPSNPAGYLRHLETLKVPMGSIAKSYVIEAVDCYVAGLFKAAAVMIGAG